MIKEDYSLYDEPFPLQFLVYKDSAREQITVDRVLQEDGSFLWAVRDSGRMCLSVEGSWDYEPFPSSRLDGWSETHRFKELADAWVAAREAAFDMLEDYKERVRRLNEKSAT